MMEIVPGKGKAIALNVVIGGGTPTIVNVHGPAGGDDSWASKASSWAAVAMYEAAKSDGDTTSVLIWGDFKDWLESAGHPTTKRFTVLWKQCRLVRAGHSAEEDRQPTREGHKMDSYLLNARLDLWAMREGPYLAPGRPPTALRSDRGPVALGIPLAVAAEDSITRLAYSHAQDRLHARRSDSPGTQEVAAAVVQRDCDDPTLQNWLSSERDEASMDTPAVQFVFDLLYAFRRNR